MHSWLIWCSTQESLLEIVQLWQSLVCDTYTATEIKILQSLCNMEQSLQTWIWDVLAPLEVYCVQVLQPSCATDPRSTKTTDCTLNCSTVSAVWSYVCRTCTYIKTDLKIHIIIRCWACKHHSSRFGTLLCTSVAHPSGLGQRQSMCPPVHQYPPTLHQPQMADGGSQWSSCWKY